MVPDEQGQRAPASVPPRSRPIARAGKATLAGAPSTAARAMPHTNEESKI